MQERKRIAGVEQDDIINPSPRAEIPKSQDVIISYGCVTNPGTSASVAVARAMQQYHTRTSPPPLHRQSPPWKPETRFSAGASSKQVSQLILTTLLPVSIPAPAHIAAEPPQLDDYYLTQTLQVTNKNAALLPPPCADVNVSGYP